MYLLWSYIADSRLCYGIVICYSFSLGVATIKKEDYKIINGCDMLPWHTQFMNTGTGITSPSRIIGPRGNPVGCELAYGKNIFVVFVFET